MADPQAATLTQLRNIQIKTGKTIAQLHAVLAASGLTRTGERRSLLMERFKLGYGDANAVALFMASHCLIWATARQHPWQRLVIRWTPSTSVRRLTCGPYLML
jgi:hypothetical protein